MSSMLPLFPGAAALPAARTLQGLADFAIVESYRSTAAKWGIPKLDASAACSTTMPGSHLDTNPRPDKPAAPAHVTSRG